MIVAPNNSYGIREHDYEMLKESNHWLCHLLFTTMDYDINTSGKRS